MSPLAGRDRLVLVVLVVLPLAVYARVVGFDFVNYDDPKYVTDNPVVQAGLTASGLGWAMTSGHAANWHPVTWTSHMLDCQVFGLRAGLHHATNLLLHLANGVLWFLVFRRMTGAGWRSALVAALFALHPAHVESVAWVAERKDVLSTLFWVITLWWYVRWVRTGSLAAYGIALVAYALGLMAKPMLVSLPLTLFLLDWWPLDRWSTRDSRVRLLLDKVPFLALALADGVVTFLVQRAAGAIDVGIPLGVRLANVVVSYVAYLRMAIWPAGLAVYYPLTTSVPAWEALAAGVALALATALVVRSARPYLVVGWGWYLVTLLPVIGFVQVGGRALADRYTYVSFIGLFVMAVWGAADLARRWSLPSTLVAGAAAGVLAACAAVTWVQVGYWRDSVTLFRHALAVTSDSFVAHANLGLALEEQGDLEGASAHLEASLALNPDADAAYNLANVRLAQQRLPEAVELYERSLQAAPRAVKTLYNLASALDNLGRTDDAIRRYQQALRIDPANVDVRNNLGITLLRAGRLDEAAAEFEAAVRRAPDDPLVHRNLGALYGEREDWPRAAAEYELARRALPDDVDLIEDSSLALTSAGRVGDAARLLEDAVARLPAETRLVGALAWLRATSQDPRARDGAEAVRLAERACAPERTPDCLDTLAAAYAEAGRFADAIRAVRAALDHADTTPEFRDEVRERAALYEMNEPYHVQ